MFFIFKTVFLRGRSTLTPKIFKKKKKKLKKTTKKNNKKKQKISRHHEHK